MKPIELPNKEQMIYSHLCIVESLLEYIKDGCIDTQFDELHSYFSNSLKNIEGCRKIMVKIMRRTPVSNNVCY